MEIFTFSLGNIVSLGGGFSASYSESIAFDSDGNIGIFESTSGGGVTTPNVTGGGFISITSAPSIDKLSGESFQVGGSGSFGVICVGAEAVLFEDAKTGKNYGGVTVFGGASLSLAPVEFHVEYATSKMLYKVNLYEAWDDFYNAVMEW